MRNVINTTANVTTVAIINREVRTVLAGVDALRAFPRHLRLYAAPAHAAWALACGQAPLAGKQPAKQGSKPGGSDQMSRCMRRDESSRCGRPRVSSCLRGS
jgi:hypothetical protein